MFTCLSCFVPFFCSANGTFAGEFHVGFAAFLCTRACLFVSTCHSTSILQHIAEHVSHDFFLAFDKEYA